MPDLDLENGDPSAAEKILEAGQAARASRGRGRPKGSTSQSKRKAPAFTEADDKTLQGRLVKFFQDLSDQAIAREDGELADVLNRRKEPMAQGIVSLTRNIPFLRGPVVLLINFLEPCIAFWELGTLGVNRYIARQQRKRFEREQVVNGVPAVAE